jgi:hypothetical protein
MIEREGGVWDMWGMGWGEVLPRPHLLGAEVKLIPGILGWKEKGNIYITVLRNLFFLLPNRE